MGRGEIFTLAEGFGIRSNAKGVSLRDEPETPIPDLVIYVVPVVNGVSCET